MLHRLGLRGGPSAAAGDGATGASSPSAAPAGNGGGAAGGLGRPLRLVYCDDKGKFVMDPEAVAALQLVKGPVGVVSVCGRARQGKSFVLNQVLLPRALLPFIRGLIEERARRMRVLGFPRCFRGLVHRRV